MTCAVMVWESADRAIWRTRASLAKRRPASSACGRTLRRMVAWSIQESGDGRRDSGCIDMVRSRSRFSLSSRRQSAVMRVRTVETHVMHLSALRGAGSFYTFRFTDKNDCQPQFSVAIMTLPHR